MNVLGKTDSCTINLNVQGGKLIVSFVKEDSVFKKVMLKGPAKFVFNGIIEI